MGETMEYLIILIFIICIILILFLYKNILTVSKYNVVSNKIPKSFEGYKIVHLSDLHSKSFGRNNIRLINKIESLNPDIVVMTGDMASKKSSNYKIEELVKILSKKYNVYYSFGNHEMIQKHSDLKKLKNELINSGATLLCDRNVDIVKNGDKIRIYGLNFKFNMEVKNRSELISKKYINMIDKSIGRFDENLYNILLAHDPLNYELYDYLKSDLVLSGHVHGGIIRLFGMGIFSPRRRFFPKYSGGMYKGNNGCMVVSRGLGDSKLRIRLFNFPDIVQITLKNS